MKCPYCGADMEDGVIYGTHEVAWLKEEVMVIDSRLNEGSVRLSPKSFWRRPCVRAWLCRDCRKVIIDY